MPGSTTTPGLVGARAVAPTRVAFRKQNGVGTRNEGLSRLNGWPMLSPTDASSFATHGADVVRYSFIAVDFHHLLLAGLTGALCLSPR